MLPLMSRLLCDRVELMDPSVGDVCKLCRYPALASQGVPTKQEYSISERLQGRTEHCRAHSQQMHLPVLKFSLPFQKANSPGMSEAGCEGCYSSSPPLLDSSAHLIALVCTLHVLSDFKSSGSETM